MKPRLHIPMSQNQTTRQRRRVVWIMAEVLIIFGLLFTSARLFLLRSTLLAMAPAEADIAVTFVGERALLGFFDHLGSRQAVSGQPFTFNDLRPYIGREMALFIERETGSQSVAFQGLLDDGVKTLWSNYGLVVEEFGQITRLGNMVNGVPNKETDFSLASLYPRYGGAVVLQGERGTLIHTKKGFLLKVHTGVDKSNIPQGRNESSLAMIPVEWKNWKELGPKSTGFVHLFADKDGLGYLIRMDQKLDSQLLAKMVKKVALLQEPAVSSVVLPDQSIVQELRLNDENIGTTIEELEQGVRIVAVREGHQTITGWTEWEQTFLSDREVTTTGESGNGQSSSCLKSAAIFALPKKLSVAQLFSLHGIYEAPGLLESFEEIAISKEKIKFCW